eukprot:CFRG2092T1
MESYYLRVCVVNTGARFSLNANGGTDSPPLVDLLSLSSGVESQNIVLLLPNGFSVKNWNELKLKGQKGGVIASGNSIERGEGTFSTVMDLFLFDESTIRSTEPPPPDIQCFMEASRPALDVTLKPWLGETQAECLDEASEQDRLADEMLSLAHTKMDSCKAYVRGIELQCIGLMSARDQVLTACDELEIQFVNEYDRMLTYSTTELERIDQTVQMLKIVYTSHPFNVIHSVPSPPAQSLQESITIYSESNSNSGESGHSLNGTYSPLQFPDMEPLAENSIESLCVIHTQDIQDMEARLRMAASKRSGMVNRYGKARDKFPDPTIWRSQLNGNLDPLLATVATLRERIDNMNVLVSLQEGLMKQVRNVALRPIFAVIPAGTMLATSNAPARLDDLHSALNRRQNILVDMAGNDRKLSQFVETYKDHNVDLSVAVHTYFRTIVGYNRTLRQVCSRKLLETFPLVQQHMMKTIEELSFIPTQLISILQVLPEAVTRQHFVNTYSQEAISAMIAQKSCVELRRRQEFDDAHDDIVPSPLMQLLTDATIPIRITGYHGMDASSNASVSMVNSWSGGGVVGEGTGGGRNLSPVLWSLFFTWDDIVTLQQRLEKFGIHATPYVDLLKECLASMRAGAEAQDDTLRITHANNRRTNVQTRTNVQKLTPDIHGWSANDSYLDAAEAFSSDSGGTNVHALKSVGFENQHHNLLHTTQTRIHPGAHALTNISEAMDNRVGAGMGQNRTGSMSDDMSQSVLDEEEVCNAICTDLDDTNTFSRLKRDVGVGGYISMDESVRVDVPVSPDNLNRAHCLGVGLASTRIVEHDECESDVHTIPTSHSSSNVQAHIHTEACSEMAVLLERISSLSSIATSREQEAQELREKLRTREQLIAQLRLELLELRAKNTKIDAQFSEKSNTERGECASASNSASVDDRVEFVGTAVEGTVENVESVNLRRNMYLYRRLESSATPCDDSSPSVSTNIQTSTQVSHTSNSITCTKETQNTITNEISSVGAQTRISDTTDIYGQISKAHCEKDNHTYEAELGALRILLEEANATINFFRHSTSPSSPLTNTGEDTRICLNAQCVRREKDNLKLSKQLHMIRAYAYRLQDALSVYCGAMAVLACAAGVGVSGDVVEWCRMHDNASNTHVEDRLSMSSNIRTKRPGDESDGAKVVESINLDRYLIRWVSTTPQMAYQSASIPVSISPSHTHTNRRSELATGSNFGDIINSSEQSKSSVRMKQSAGSMTMSTYKGGVDIRDCATRSTLVHSSDHGDEKECTCVHGQLNASTCTCVHVYGYADGLTQSSSVETDLTLPDVDGEIVKETERSLGATESDKLSVRDFEVDTLVLFIPLTSGGWFAFNIDQPHFYLHASCVADYDLDPKCVSAFVGRVVYIEKFLAGHDSYNPFGLETGTTFYEVIAIEEAKSKRPSRRHNSRHANNRNSMASCPTAINTTRRSPIAPLTPIAREYHFGTYKLVSLDKHFLHGINAKYA